MSFHVYQILELGPLQPNEQVFENFTDSRTGAPTTTEDLSTIHQTSSNEITAQYPTHPTPSGEIVPHPIISWEPSQKFMQVKQKFESYILYQYPCVPCSFCSRLLYPEKAKWTQKIENFEYPLIQANLNLRLIENPNPPENRIAVCSSCKKNPRRNFPPYLHPIPVEIQQIPLFKRKYLSLIYLHSSLGRTSNLGAYSEYRSIVGTFGYSKNIRSLTLYSGMIGAFLEEYNPNSQDHCWFDRSLIAGANWLADNNPYLREYKNALVTNSSGSVSSFPTATHLSDDETAPEFQSGDIIVPHQNFPSEIHNEDSHYSRLIAGFIKNDDSNDDSNSLPVSFDFDHLEALLFPDLFPDGHGDYKEMKSCSRNQQQRIDTYGKYIKQRLLGVDSRFRLHHHWPAWSYLQLEKLRNFQNNQRIANQKNVDGTHRLPTAVEIIEKSAYMSGWRFSETNTSTIPSFIRTGDTYFNQKLMHLNTMIRNLNLPTLFITLSMAESHWIHLRHILGASDNFDTVPSNRPLHTTLHFIHRHQNLKRLIWKDPDVSGWGNCKDYFERVEFQNRGAAHTHSVYWTSKPIEEMISENVIRSDVPDPNLEPELYECVMRLQIHSCNSKCDGPAPYGERCKKGFPQPFSPHTYADPNNLRYTYRCVNPLDQWVVPYHASTLLIWNAHMNIQYITSRGLAKYINKYIAKPEPSHLFNVKEGDLFHEYVHARRLGSMELMFLLLGETICNSSVQVKYIVTDPPSVRSKCILPFSRINLDDDELYWKDLIEKYLARPNGEPFDNITYKDYIEQYDIKLSAINSSSRTIYRDNLGNYVVKRKTNILTRYRNLQLEHGELYFYQKLLLRVPARSEGDLIGTYETYRDHYLARFPEEFGNSIKSDQQNQHHQTINMLDQYTNLIENLLYSLQSLLTQDIKGIIKSQLENIKILPPIVPNNSMLSLPSCQYNCVQTIFNYMGPRDTYHYPYFFISGSAGTGKSFLINLFAKKFSELNKNFLLMAPTGVAAVNIQGQTIHSALRIWSHSGRYQTLAFTDQEFKQELRKIDTIIIDEISMVQASLLTFISEMFSGIHQIFAPFGGINVILIGDLAQLPPINGHPVYQSPVWKVFYPIFLRHSHRQQNDPFFYNILQKIRLGNITPSVWRFLQEKANQSLSLEMSSLHTSYIVGFRKSASYINQIICNHLPALNNKFMISEAIDCVDGRMVDNSYEHLIKNKTNLPGSLRLQLGAKVMFLNNSQIHHQICNGSFGIIIDIDIENNNVRVAFSVSSAIVDIAVSKQTSHFLINGVPATRTQFPLHNAFALTVHKCQGLTLPDVSLSLDSQIFTSGQAYVSLSRCSKWEDVKINSLSRGAFKVDPSMIKEYERLEEIATRPLPYTVHGAHQFANNSS